MNTITPDALLKSLEWRYAVKKFDPVRKVPEATWKTLEEAARLAPSSYGLQPYRMLVITDASAKAKLPEITWNQPQPKDCSHFVVFASRVGIGPADVDRYVDLISAVRGVPKEGLAQFRDMMLGTVKSTPAEKLDDWCARQAYIALGFLLAACAALGVDACPMEGIDAPKYDERFGLPARGYRAVAACAVGYRDRDDWLASLKKVRTQSKDLVIRV